MFCKVLSSAICGVDAVPISVEADISNGLPSFTIVGSVSSIVREAEDRVRTALRSNGIPLPPKRITINLAPGFFRKDGTRFDLPIAAALLMALEVIPPESLKDCMILGELHLNGETESVNGILPGIIMAKSAGSGTCIVPYGNAGEASQVPEMKIVPVRSLGDLILYCSGKMDCPVPHAASGLIRTGIPDFSDISGQESLKRACVIAAAGFHNLLLSGPPGSGKSMAAKRIPSILPPLSEEEILEVSRIYSVAGLLNEDLPLIRDRPFRSPHHSLSAQALCGGGSVPVPGEITLAHRGVLYLDEMAEMPSKIINLLRIPLEDHSISISRVSGRCTFPADFLFVASVNPCPCGYYPDRNRCTCTVHEIRRYQKRLSRPILDRIDLKADVKNVGIADLNPASIKGPGSAEMRKQVMEAAAIQSDRYRNKKIRFNAALEPAGLSEACPLSPDAESTLQKAFRHFSLSVRGYHKLLKVARTIADLEQSEQIKESHISEALCYRHDTVPI